KSFFRVHDHLVEVLDRRAAVVEQNAAKDVRTLGEARPGALRESRTSEYQTEKNGNQPGPAARGTANEADTRARWPRPRRPATRETCAIFHVRMRAPATNSSHPTTVSTWSPGILGMDGIPGVATPPPHPPAENDGSRRWRRTAIRGAGRNVGMRLPNRLIIEE